MAKVLTKKPKVEPRHCYYALMDKHYGGKPHVVMVFEGKSGYRLVNPDTDLGGPCKDMEQAKHCADYWNKVVKLTAADVDKIVRSSMDERAK